MRRFYTDPQFISELSAEIYEDAPHIAKVLRMKPDDKILLFDGTGYEYEAVLTSVDKDICRANIISKKYSEQEPSIKVYIFQGLPKSDKMESIIQKSAELGVYEIIPVNTERCVVKLDKKKQDDKIKRWNKVSTEAAKQCGRGILPKIKPVISFKDAVNISRELDLVIMPYEELGHMGVSNLKSVLKNTDAKSIGIIIGPEGGFSPEEASFAEKSGVIMTGLGKRILRTETVAPALLSIIMYETDY